MAKSSSITVKILGDAKGLQKELDESSGALGRFGSGIGSAAKVAGAAIAGIGLGAIAMAPSILSAGSELEALGKKAATVFEGSLGTAQAWAKENAGAMGLTADQAVGLGAGIADLLKPMGFTADAATGMATNMMDMSGALSAWSGGQKSAAEVSDIITKAMLGETDGLKSLGIAISAADVEARLAAKGQGELTGAAREQAEALAIQELIMEKSTDAQKAWADGSMDGMKAQNEAKASMEELKETAIKALYPAFEALLPIATQVAQWLGERLPGAIEWLKGVISDLVAKFREWWPTIQAVIGAVVDWLTTVAWPALQVVWDAIVAGVGVLVDWVRTHWDQIKSIIEQAIGFVRGAIDSGVAVIQALWSAFGDTLIAGVQNAWDTISGVVQAAIDVVRGIINTAMGLIHGDFSQVWEGIKGIVSGVWDGITAVVSGAINNVKAVLSLAWDGITGAASAAWEGLKSGISGAIDAVVGFVTGLPGRVLDVAVGLLNAGAKLGDQFLQGLKDGLSAVAGFAGDVADSIVGAVKDAWNTVAGLINDFVPNQIGWGAFSLDLPDNPIPTFHSGGVTNFGSAGEGLALLRNNEAIVPLDSPTDARRVMAEAGLTGGRQLVVNNYRRDLTVGDLAQVLAMERLAS